MTTELTTFAPPAAPAAAAANPGGSLAPSATTADDALSPVVPSDARAYTFTAPQGVTIDQAEYDAFRQRAKGYGLTGAQFKSVMGEAMTALPQLVDAALVRTEDAAQAAMKAEWGAQYDANLMKIRGLVQRFGGVSDAGAAQITTSPVMMRLALRLADAFATSGARVAQSGAPSSPAPVADSRDILSDRDVAGIVAKMISLPEGSADRLHWAGVLKRSSAAKLRAQGVNPEATQL